MVFECKYSLSRLNNKENERTKDILKNNYYSFIPLYNMSKNASAYFCESISVFSE